MRRARLTLVLVGLYTLLALAATYPLVTGLDTHHPGEAAGDAKTYLWNYWWIDRAVTVTRQNPLETDMIFHPIGIGLSLHTLGLAQGLAQIPLRHALGPTLAANIWILWTFVASGLFTFGLARRVGLTRAAAFFSGTVFAFCPYRLARLAGHYDLLGTEWIALYAWMLLSAFDESVPRRRWYLFAAILSAALAGYTALTYLVFLAIFTTVWISHRYLVSRERRSEVLVSAAILFSGVGVAMTPMFAQLAEDASWNYPPYAGAERFSADALAYFYPSPNQTLTTRIGRRWDPNQTETTVFLGWVVLALLVVAAVQQRSRRPFLFWWICLGVFGVLSLGPSLRFGGTATGFPLPFSLLQMLPGLEQLRAPSRFAVLVVLSAAVLAGSAVDTSTRRLAAGRAVGSVLISAFVSVSVFAEFWTAPVPTFEVRKDEILETIRSQDPGLVLEIPGIEQQPEVTMFHQTIHENPILVGTAARVPREKLDYFLGLHLIRPLIDLRKGKLSLDSELIDREKHLAPHVARFVDLGYLIFDRAYDRRDARAFAEAVLPLHILGEDEHRVAYRVDRSALPASPRRLEAGSQLSRQHFAAGWLNSSSEADGTEARWANRRRASILFRWPQGQTRVLEIEIAPADGFSDREPLSVRTRLNGHALGHAQELQPDWQRLRIRLDPDVDRNDLGRLELQFSRLLSERLASGATRNVAARVRSVSLIP